jgi:hypothetical protein
MSSNFHSKSVSHNTLKTILDRVESPFSKNIRDYKVPVKSMSTIRVQHFPDTYEFNTISILSNLLINSPINVSLRKQLIIYLFH